MKCCRLCSQGSSKLEKAEILQMTVDHLKLLHAMGGKGGRSFYFVVIDACDFCRRVDFYTGNTCMCYSWDFQNCPVAEEEKSLCVFDNVGNLHQTTALKVKKTYEKSI